MRRLLKNNGLLFDRPASYWTLIVFSANAAFFALVAAGKPIPLLLGLAEPLATLPWLFVFLKGGGWDWIQQRIPERMKAPPPEIGTSEKPQKPGKGPIY